MTTFCLSAVQFGLCRPYEAIFYYQVQPILLKCWYNMIQYISKLLPQLQNIIYLYRLWNRLIYTIWYKRISFIQIKQIVHRWPIQFDRNSSVSFMEESVTTVVSLCHFWNYWPIQFDAKVFVFLNQTDTLLGNAIWYKLDTISYKRIRFNKLHRWVIPFDQNSFVSWTQSVTSFSKQCDTSLLSDAIWCKSICFISETNWYTIAWLVQTHLYHF